MKKSKSSTDIRLGTRAEVALRRAQEELLDAQNDIINLSSSSAQELSHRPVMPESRTVAETSMSLVEISLIFSTIAAIAVGVFLLFGRLSSQEMRSDLKNSFTGVSSAALPLSAATPSDQLQSATWAQGARSSAPWASGKTDRIASSHNDFALHVTSYTTSTLPPAWSQSNPTLQLLHQPSENTPIVMEVSAVQIPTRGCELLALDLSTSTIGVLINKTPLSNTPTPTAIQYACAAAKDAGAVMKVRALYAVPSPLSPALPSFPVTNPPSPAIMN